MPAFKIILDGFDDQTVNAAYYVNEDDFVTFKDDDHKQVSCFRADRVVSVSRTQQTTSIGTVHVSIAPKLDEKAMRNLLAEVDRRIVSHTGRRLS